MLSVTVRTVVAQAYSWLRMPLHGTAARSHVVALNYHYFTVGRIGSYLEVSREVVESQLRALLRKYSVCRAKPTLEAIFRGESDGDHPKVIITIDDGCASFEIIRPLIEKYQIPVVMFVPVGLCLDHDDLDGLRSKCLRLYKEVDLAQYRFKLPTHAIEFFQLILAAEASELHALEEYFVKVRRHPAPISTRRMYRTSELRTLAGDPLVSLAAHSMSHQALGSLPSPWLEWEIATSCRRITDLGGDSELFAYPYAGPGSVDARCVRALQRAKSKFAFTTLGYRISETCDTFMLGRSTVFNCPDRHYIWGTASGGLERYEILRHGRQVYDTYTRLSPHARSGGRSE